MSVKLGDELFVSEWSPVAAGVLVREFTCDGRTLVTTGGGNIGLTVRQNPAGMVNAANANQDQDGLRASLDGVSDFDPAESYAGVPFRLWLRLPPKSPFFGAAGISYEVKATFGAAEVSDSGTISPGFGTVVFDASLSDGGDSAVGNITITLSGSAEGSDPENPEDPGWGVGICTITATIDSVDPDPGGSNPSPGELILDGSRNHVIYGPGLYNEGLADDDFTVLLQWGSYTLMWKNLGPV